MCLRSRLMGRSLRSFVLALRLTSQGSFVATGTEIYGYENDPSVRTERVRQHYHRSTQYNLRRRIDRDRKREREHAL